jgi:hypothetical protein
MSLREILYVKDGQGGKFGPDGVAIQCKPLSSVWSNKERGMETSRLQVSTQAT